MPKGEILLWQKINNKKSGYKFRRQYSIENYVIDFYCPELKLAIEVDGLTHNDLKSAEEDELRQKHIESLGIKIIRFSSTEIFEDLDSIATQVYFVCKNLKDDMK